MANQKAVCLLKGMSRAGSNATIESEAMVATDDKLERYESGFQQPKTEIGTDATR